MIPQFNRPFTVAITRTDNIGDVVTTLPMCGIIKQHYPQARILFIGREYTKDIITACSDVDEFLDVQSLYKDSKTAVKILKEAAIDVIIIVFPNKKIAKLAFKARIPYRVGTSHRIYNVLYCNKNVGFSRKNMPLNEAQLNIFLLKQFKDCFRHYTMDELSDYVRLSKPEKTEINQQLDKTKFNLIIHPKSNGHGREWPVEYFKQLTELLDERVKIFVCGTQKESLGVDIKGDNVVNMFGKMSLKEYISFIAHSDALLASGTGPLHVAGILNVHAIGLFPPMQGIDPQRWHPLGKKVKVFCHDKPGCKDCKKGNRCTCMDKITPQEVASYINSLIAK